MEHEVITCREVQSTNEITNIRRPWIVSVGIVGFVAVVYVCAGATTGLKFVGRCIKKVL